MALKIKKDDATSSANLAEALRSQITEFPPYLHDNWDSIESSMCDYIEEIDGNFHIIHCFKKDWLEEHAPVYASIINRLASDYPRIRVEFQ